MNTAIKTVKTDNFTMQYLEFGKGPEPLVILPGISVQSVLGSAQSVKGAYRLLAGHYTICLFDRRADLPPEYSVYDMARDTAEAIEAIGLDRVNLFGVSQGGMIAMKIAIDHPQLVKKLVLGSTSARITDEQFHSLDQWTALAKEGKAAELYHAFGKALFPEAAYEQFREMLTETAKTVTEEDLRRFIILANGTQHFDVHDDLTKISCPVLLMGSEDDRVLGAEASRQIAEKLEGRPGFIFHMYNGYGHAAYDMAPDYKQRILDFLLND